MLSTSDWLTVMHVGLMSNFALNSEGTSGKQVAAPIMIRGLRGAFQAALLRGMITITVTV